jgi:hypothetical protein
LRPRRRISATLRGSAPPSGWERQFPSCVPPSWFCTTSTVCSSETARPCGHASTARRTGMWFTWSSGANGSLRSRLLPRAAGRADALHQRSFCCTVLRRVRVSLLRWRCHPGASAHGTGTWSAPRSRTVRCLCGGKNPIEVAAPWPFTAALLDLSTRRRVVALEDLRPVRAANVCCPSRATLLTLAPTFPTRSGPCDPTALVSEPSGFLSWGCPKIAPPSYEAGRSASRRCSASPRCPCCASPRRPVLLRDGNAGSHPRAAPVVSHHLDGLSLSDPATIFRPLPILGFTTFPPVAKQESARCACCPPKPSLRRQRRWVRRNPVHRGCASPRSTVSGRRVHREPCPLALCSRISAGRGLEALLHRRVRCEAGCFHPSAPGAPLGLSGSAAPCGRPARDEHAGFTSKTTPKSGSSEWSLTYQPARRTAPPSGGARTRTQDKPRGAPGRKRWKRRHGNGPDWRSKALRPRLSGKMGSSDRG